MNIKWNALYLGGFLALTSFLAQPVMADEWNKRTEFQFSGPVEIPGMVLSAGKYVFQLVDSDSDPNIVQVFSEDSSGKESLLATVLAVPDYMTETPDKPIIHFEERHSGAPEAIDSWFYPGDNTGWEFVYPKGETLQTDANTTPAPSSVTAAATPSLQEAPQVQEVAPIPEELAAVEEAVTVAQNVGPPNDPTALATAPGPDAQNTADRELPKTGGYSDLELMTGLAMLAGGIAAVFASRRKCIA